MNRSYIRHALRFIFAADAKNVTTAHRDDLELSLLGYYDKRWPRRSPLFRTMLLPALVVILIGALIGVPMKVPAEYLVEVGKRVTFFSADVSPNAFDHLIPEKGGKLEITTQLRKKPEGFLVELEVWGDSLPSDLEIENHVRDRFPSLKNGEINVQTLKGPVRNDLMHKVAWDLFRAGTSPQEIALARERLIFQLRQEEGDEADIRVNSEDEGSMKRIKIQVRKPGP